MHLTAFGSHKEHELQWFSAPGRRLKPSESQLKREAQQELTSDPQSTELEPLGVGPGWFLPSSPRGSNVWPLYNPWWEPAVWTSPHSLQLWDPEYSINCLLGRPVWVQNLVEVQVLWPKALGSVAELLSLACIKQRAGISGNPTLSLFVLCVLFLPHPRQSPKPRYFRVCRKERRYIPSQKAYPS